MIRDKDRSYYIGASDTAFVVGNWDTKSFAKWYFTKLGHCHSDYQNDAMMAGTNYERPVLESLGICEMEFDRQIIIDRLRVNLDGSTKEKIYEVKTYRNGKRFAVSKGYRDQVNVQMYAFGCRKAEIVAYALEAEDYINYFRKIDKNRLSHHEITYDHDFINEIFLPKLRCLSEYLDEGRFPSSK